MTPVASGGVLVEVGQRDHLSATFSCKSTKSYRIVSCNKSIATEQISQLSRNGSPPLAQMVARVPLVQRARGSIPGGVVNFHLKIFNLGARSGGDVHFLIARLHIIGLN